MFHSNQTTVGLDNVKTLEIVDQIKKNNIMTVNPEESVLIFSL